MSPILATVGATLGHRLQSHHPSIVSLPFQSYRSQIRSSHVITKSLGYRWINILVISLAIIFKIGSHGRFFPLLCYRRSWNGLSVTRTSLWEILRRWSSSSQLCGVDCSCIFHWSYICLYNQYQSQTTPSHVIYQDLGYRWINVLITLRAILFRDQKPWKSNPIALSSLEACFERLYSLYGIRQENSRERKFTEFDSFEVLLHNYFDLHLEWWFFERGRLTWTEEQFIITEYNSHQSSTGIFPLLLWCLVTPKKAREKADSVFLSHHHRRCTYAHAAARARRQSPSSLSKSIHGRWRSPSRHHRSLPLLRHPRLISRQHHFSSPCGRSRPT